MTRQDLLSVLDDLIKDKPCENMEAGRMALLKYYDWLLMQAEAASQYPAGSHDWCGILFQIKTVLENTVLCFFLHELTEHQHKIIRGITKSMLNECSDEFTGDLDVLDVNLAAAVYTVEQRNMTSSLLKMLGNDPVLKAAQLIWDSGGIPLSLNAILSG